MSHLALEAEVQACAERPRSPAAREFEQVFHDWPQAEAQAPGRVHLLGEHAGCNDGLVLAAPIPQQTRVAMRANGRPQFRLHVAGRGTTIDFVLQQPPAGQFASYVYGCLRLAQEEGAEIPPLDIHVDPDVPAGVGLAASAALEVATLRCLRALLSLPLDELRIAQLAQQAGMQYAGVRCGLVDPMASSLAGAGTALLLDTRSLEHRTVPLPQGSALLVLDSGLPRSAAASGASQRRAECERAAHLLGVSSLREVGSPDAIEALADEVARRRARHILAENDRVRQAAADGDAAALGELMNASHASLREDYEVSTPELDRLVQLLQQQPGVHGARLTGPGFGGACVALCESGAVQQAARAVLRDYAAAGHRGHLLVPAAQ